MLIFRSTVPSPLLAIHPPMLPPTMLLNASNGSTNVLTWPPNLVLGHTSQPIIVKRQPFDGCIAWLWINHAFTHLRQIVRVLRYTCHFPTRLGWHARMVLCQMSFDLTWRHGILTFLANDDSMFGYMLKYLTKLLHTCLCLLMLANACSQRSLTILIDRRVASNPSTVAVGPCAGFATTSPHQSNPNHLHFTYRPQTSGDVLFLD